MRQRRRLPEGKGLPGWRCLSRPTDQVRAGKADGFRRPAGPAASVPKGSGATATQGKRKPLVAMAPPAPP